MNMFSLRMECRTPDVPLEQLETDFSDIADAFYDIDGIIDPDLELDAHRSVLTFVLITEAVDEADAMVRAVTAARTALHVAGKGTPGWEDHYRLARQDVERQIGTRQIGAGR